MNKNLLVLLFFCVTGSVIKVDAKEPTKVVPFKIIFDPENSFEITLPLNSTVKQLKEEIGKHLRLSIDEQNLRYKGKYLFNGEKLFKYRIRKKSKITVDIVDKYSVKEYPFFVDLSSINPEERDKYHDSDGVRLYDLERVGFEVLPVVRFEMSFQKKLYALCKEVALETSVPVKQQIISFDGKELDKNMYLYEIKNLCVGEPLSLNVRGNTVITIKVQNGEATNIIPYDSPYGINDVLLSDVLCDFFREHGTKEEDYNIYYKERLMSLNEAIEQLALDIEPEPNLTLKYRTREDHKKKKSTEEEGFIPEYTGNHDENKPTTFEDHREDERRNHDKNKPTTFEDHREDERRNHDKNKPATVLNYSFYLVLSAALVFALIGAIDIKKKQKA